MTRVLLSLSFVFCIACGVVEAPNRPPMDNQDPMIQAARIIAEDIIGASIDLGFISIWTATEDEISGCDEKSGGNELGGCYFDQNILIRGNTFDAQSFCFTLTHELVHAGADQNGLSRDGDHNHWDWDAIVGRQECLNFAGVGSEKI